MSLLRARIKEDRFGNKVFMCPLCGHVFYKSKQYAKHIMKSHLRGLPKKRRIKKKFFERIMLLKIKKEQNLELSKFEKVLDLRTRLSGLKF